MKSKAKRSVLSWQDVEKKLIHSYTLRQLLANIAGICVCFSYFAFFDEPLVTNTDHLFTDCGIYIGCFFIHVHVPQYRGPHP